MPTRTSYPVDQFPGTVQAFGNRPGLGTPSAPGPTATAPRSPFIRPPTVFRDFEGAIPMGPFPHNAPPAKITDINPMGTDGFEFVEYTAPDPQALAGLFKVMGFRPVAKHRSKDVTLYRQGDVNFIVNAEPDSFAQSFARVHGPSACAMAFRVADAAAAFERAVELGAKPVENRVGPMELNIPAIEG